jgi:uncharacterized protein YkwD
MLRKNNFYFVVLIFTFIFFALTLKVDNKVANFGYNGHFIPFEGSYLSFLKTVILSNDPNKENFPNKLGELILLNTNFGVHLAATRSREARSGNESDNTDTKNQRLKVVDIVNQERKNRGVPLLLWDESLGVAAQLRAEELSVNFSHTRPDGSDWNTILKELSIKSNAIGENIAWGQSDPEEVMGSWMNSKGHRNNILGKQYLKIGVGAYSVEGNIYWVQIFAK